MNKVFILASGTLGHIVINSIRNEVEILAIATDSKSVDIIKYAGAFGIPLFTGNPRRGHLSEFLKAISCEVLLSINYLFLVEAAVLQRFKFPINFHGSLLPKYRGRTPHVWAIINNETKTGITAHLMNEGCDTGDIIFQKEFEISHADTGHSILLKYFEAYPGIVKTVLNQVNSGNFRITAQNETLATFYGKRTPEDGHIDWNWQKERIYNFVRALTDPYPGAFTYYNEKPIIIDKIRYSDIGFDNQIPNGSVLFATSDNAIVKTSNGAMEIIKFRAPHEQIIELNAILK
jgi:methionyl-tRNA formyltransferase